jgi:hypothetical protein
MHPDFSRMSFYYSRAEAVVAFFIVYMRGNELIGYDQRLPAIVVNSASTIFACYFKCNVTAEWNPPSSIRRSQQANLIGNYL